MSRIGKQPITLPSGVTAQISESEITITGGKGTLSFNILPGVQVESKENILHVSVKNPMVKQERAFWGLTRAMIQNMVT